VVHTKKERCFTGKEIKELLRGYVLMMLEDMLEYDQIVIQCHDDLDADTIASGYALLKYLESKGKSPRLVYSSKREVIKDSLRMMIEKLDIPLEHLQTPDGEPELLVTVDCRAGQRNVSALPYRNLAVIDHHELDAGEILPELHEVRTDCGACATVVWAMLKEAGFHVEDRLISTALYYGLYMDTQKFKGAEKMDREMLDALRFDWDIILQLQNADLALNDFRIAGSAFTNLRYNPEHHFAVAPVDTSESYMLGVVSDTMMNVHELDVCVAYCILKREQCVKVSVRCCKRKDRADELVHWLVRGMGNDGGGDRTKAAGRLPLALLKESSPDGDLLRTAGEMIYQRLTDYFNTPIRRLDPKAEAYEPARAEEFCRGKAALYCKKKMPVGYVRAVDMFPEGTEILLRMREGDIIKRVVPELYIMIGMDYEIYHTTEENLRKNYDLQDEAFPVDSRTPWPPKVYLAGTKEIRLLAPYAKKCVAKDSARIWAGQLGCRLEVLVWGDWHLGESGDWLVCREDDYRDAYIIHRPVFERTYERTE